MYTYIRCSQYNTTTEIQEEQARGETPGTCVWWSLARCTEEDR